MNGTDQLSNNRFVVAMDYLQSEYLRQGYGNTFALIQAALERLPQDGAMEDQSAALAVRAIGALIERLPEDDKRTAEIKKKYEEARGRMNGARA